MKKIIAGSLIVLGSLFFTGCGGSDVPSLNEVTKKGMVISKGMTKAKVMEILKREPDSIQKVGDFELWTYEGVVTNDDTKESRYKNLTIKFKDGKVDYTGYFACKLPKTEG